MAETQTCEGKIIRLDSYLYEFHTVMSGFVRKCSADCPENVPRIILKPPSPHPLQLSSAQSSFSASAHAQAHAQSADLPSPPPPPFPSPPCGSTAFLFSFFARGRRWGRARAGQQEVPAGAGPFRSGAVEDRSGHGRFPRRRGAGHGAHAGGGPRRACGGHARVRSWRARSRGVKGRCIVFVVHMFFIS